MASNLDDLDKLNAVNQLAAIIWSAADAIVGKRLDGTITSWNLGAEKLFGYSASEIVGQPITLLLPSDRLDEEAGIIAQLIQGRRIDHFETVRRRKDGTLIDVSVSIAPVLDSNDRVVGASKIARDISKLVEIRRRELRLTQFMRALVRAGRAISEPLTDRDLLVEICRICVDLGGVDAACIVEPDHAQLRCEAFAGLSAEQADALARQDWLRAAVVQSGQSGRAIAAGRPGELTPAQPAMALASVPFRRGADVSGWLVLLASRSDFFDDAILDLMVELASDLSFGLTHRSRINEFEGIVQSSSDAIIAVDADRRVLRINPAATEMFLWPEAEALGQPIDRLIPESQRAGHATLMEGFASNEAAPRRMGPARSLTGLRTNGEAFPIEATVSRFGKGPDLRMIVAARDVSERRLAEQAAGARQAAEAASRAKTEFLSHMSHELRTPLNAILGFTHVLLHDDRAPQTERQAAHLRHIRDAGKHLHVLLSDLLDMARIESGQLQVECHALSAGGVLDEVLAVVAPLARSAEVTIATQAVPAELPPVMADATRLRQVFLNLVSNAVKYNRPGGSVTIDVGVSPDRITLCIADSGIGMSPAQLDQLFQPYNRLGREGGRVDGMGIGLVVTRKLVQLMDATLHFASEPGQGTRAYLSLPRAPVPEKPEEAPTTTSGVIDAELLAGLVLAVEDDPVNQLLVKTVLEQWPGIELVQAVDGRSGLDLARARPPDLVLLDMTLPDMDGFQFLSALAADARVATTPVVVLSGTAEAAEVARAMSTGVLDYLTKPIEWPRLIERLRAVLGGGR